MSSVAQAVDSQSASSSSVIPTIGRILIGVPFIMSGLGKLFAMAGTVAMIQAAGLPLPALGWLIAVVIELGFGTLLVLGYRARIVAAVLAVFAFATALCFHHNFADQNQMIHFLKNVMIAGGLLQIVHFGAGAYSLDARKRA
jgi:putative oxidoreductase